MQCQQLVTIDSCCDPQQCPEPASMHQATTGAALCASHYANGAKYAIDGTWAVGNRSVPMPDGWAAIDGVEAGATELEVVGGETTSAGGLVIERSALTGSGLVLERAAGGPREAEQELERELEGRAGGEDQT